MANGKQIEENNQKIFLLNQVITDNTISDNGVMVYCYLRSIQKASKNQYFVSTGSISFFFNQEIGLTTKRKKKYIDGLNDLEDHGLIKMISSNVNDYVYDLSGIYFNPLETNKENKMFFTVISLKELENIMQINDTEYNPDKAKLLRYYLIVVSTFLKGKRYAYALNEEEKRDGIIGFETIENLSNKSNLSVNSVIAYNLLLEKYEILHVYRANTLKIVNKEVNGISNTYGRYADRKLIDLIGEEHKNMYSYDKDYDNIVRRSKRTKSRKSIGIKYHHLVDRGKEYDEKTIKQIYQYAVEYNNTHEENDFNKHKDLDFFKKYAFLSIQD